MKELITLIGHKVHVQCIIQILPSDLCAKVYITYKNKKCGMSATETTLHPLDIRSCGMSANGTTLRPLDIRRCGMSANETTLHPSHKL